MSGIGCYRWWVCAVFALGGAMSQHWEIGAPFLAAAIVIAEVEERDNRIRSALNQGADDGR